MAYFSTIFSETILFSLYVFICLTLMKPRFPKRMCALIYSGVILCISGTVAALTIAGYGMAALTMLPLIAYLPFSICVYVLSSGGLFETASACSLGALSTLSIKTLKRTLPWLFPSISGPALDVTILLTIFILAVGIALYVFRHIRKSFYICTYTNKENKLLILIPVSTVFLMFFINFNSTSVPILITTLLMAVSFFVIISRLFSYMAKIEEANETERKLAESLALQRKSFEELLQSFESGRHYRHDMRHHLVALAGMARQNNSVEILEYIQKLYDTTELSTPSMYCKNPALNAVISEFVNRAKNIGCKIEHKIVIPEKIPFDIPDVCVIISNALENALHACEKCPEDTRRIKLTVDFSDECKFKVLVKNSCVDNVNIDSSGLPIISKHDGDHGIGIRSVKRTVEKYNGFVSCSCENGEFTFLAEIFVTLNIASQNDITSERHERSKALSAVVTTIICLIAVLNFSPTTASALSDTLSIDIKTISYGFGDNNFKANYSVFKYNQSVDLNRVTMTFLNEASEMFWKYAMQKYEGYVSSDSGYQIITNNTKYLSIKFYTTLNVGGSVDYSRCVTVEKNSGKVLELSDLFSKKRDFIAEISAEVLNQMKEQVEKGEANYFIPGGIWNDDECFKEISPDQNFYIDPDGRLVIVFEEYTVAPGSEGSPEFIMPDKIFRYMGY